MFTFNLYSRAASCFLMAGPLSKELVYEIIVIFLIILVIFGPSKCAFAAEPGDDFETYSKDIVIKK